MDNLQINYYKKYKKYKIKYIELNKKTGGSGGTGKSIVSRISNLFHTFYSSSPQQFDKDDLNPDIINLCENIKKEEINTREKISNDLELDDIALLKNMLEENPELKNILHLTLYPITIENIDKWKKKVDLEILNEFSISRYDGYIAGNITEEITKNNLFYIFDKSETQIPTYTLYCPKVQDIKLYQTNIFNINKRKNTTILVFPNDRDSIRKLSEVYENIRSNFATQIVNRKFRYTKLERLEIQKELESDPSLIQINQEYASQLNPEEGNHYRPPMNVQKPIIRNKIIKKVLDNFFNTNNKYLFYTDKYKNVKWLLEIDKPSIEYVDKGPQDNSPLGKYVKLSLDKENITIWKYEPDIDMYDEDLFYKEAIKEDIQ